MAANRIYKATVGDQVKLVQASSVNRVISHVLRGQNVQVEVPTPNELHGLGLAGVSVEVVPKAATGRKPKAPAAESALA